MVDVRTQAPTGRSIPPAQGRLARPGRGHHRASRRHRPGEDHRPGPHGRPGRRLRHLRRHRGPGRPRHRRHRPGAVRRRVAPWRASGPPTSSSASSSAWPGPSPGRNAPPRKTHRPSGVDHLWNEGARPRRRPVPRGSHERHQRRHPPGHHHRLRPRRPDLGHLHGPRQPRAARHRGRALLHQRPARRPADADHRRRELPGLPRGRHRPRADGAHARAGDPLRRRRPHREGHPGRLLRPPLRRVGRRPRRGRAHLPRPVDHHLDRAPSR